MDQDKGDGRMTFTDGGWRPGADLAAGYFPAALRTASLMRSCQPGPPSLKCSRTSWSMRSVTCSFAPGITFCFGGAAATFAVTFLNAASASLRASFSVRGRLGWSAISYFLQRHG